MTKTAAHRTFGLLMGAGVVVLAASIHLFWPRVEPDPKAVPSMPDSFTSSPVPQEITSIMRPDPVVTEGREELTVQGLFVSGRVRDRVTLEPVEYYDLELQIKGAAVHRTVRSKEGAFFFPLDQGGKARLVIRSAAHREAVVEDLVLPVQDLLIELDPGLCVQGLVVEAGTGEPVAGVLVVPLDDVENSAHGPHAMSGDDGTFMLWGLEAMPDRDRFRIAALHPEFAEGVADAKPGGSEAVTVVLDEGFYIYGWAYDDAGKPLPGLRIRMAGDEAPVARHAMTRKNGSFRTAPARPGRIYLTAEEGPRPPGVQPRFTRETRIVEIDDRDVQVNFGLYPHQVTWRGALLDVEGEPVAGARIVITPDRLSPRTARRYQMARTAKTSPHGRFEFRKLGMGSYEVDLFLPGNRSHIDWEEVAFVRPGVVERDLEIRGGALCGRIVDAVTGRVLEGKRGAVHLMKAARGFKGYHAGIDDSGAFCLSGLASGRYDVTAAVRGYPVARLQGIEVKEGEVKEDLEIQIPAGGELRLRLEGFFEEAYRTFSVSLVHESGRTLSFPDRSMPGSGRFEETHVLHGGAWNAHLSFGEWAYAERRFEIESGKKTSVTFQPEEVRFHRGPTTLVGSVVLADGAPAAGIRMRFELDAVKLSCTTGEDGCFVLPGFVTGNWKVRALAAAGGEMRLEALVIPCDAPYSMTRTFMIPSGTVRGRVIEGAGLRWWASVQDLLTLEPVSECEGGPADGAFELCGVSSGEYRLVVSAEGFSDYRSASFYLAPGQALDLGEVGLAPCGVMDLEVKDRTGSPVPSVQVQFNGETLPAFCPKALSPGIYRLNKAPLGPAVLTLKADGFASHDLYIDLEPGKAGDYHVVME